MRRTALHCPPVLLASSGGKPAQQVPAAAESVAANPGDARLVATASDARSPRPVFTGAFHRPPRHFESSADHGMDDDVINHRFLVWNAGDSAGF